MNDVYTANLLRGQIEHREAECRRAERDGDKEAVRLHALRLNELRRLADMTRSVGA